MSQDQLANLVAKLNEVLRRVVDVQAGTVVAGPMLTVNLDAGRGTILQPSTLVRVAVGDRVWVLRLGVFSLIIGVGGGRNPGYIVIDGQRYRTSGTLAAIGSTWTAHSSGLLYCTKTAQLPYEPPPGWHFHIAPVTAGSGFVFGTQHTVGSATMRLMGTTNPTTVTCDWQLIQD